MLWLDTCCIANGGNAKYTYTCCVQDVMKLHVLEQHALLELQLTATESSVPAASLAGTSHVSAGSFLPLLKLLTESPSHGVRQLAGKLLSRRMTKLLGNSSAGAGQEEEVWLGLLPRMPDRATAANKSVPDRAGCCVVILVARICLGVEMCW